MIVYDIDQMGNNLKSNSICLQEGPLLSLSMHQQVNRVSHILIAIDNDRIIQIKPNTILLINIVSPHLIYIKLIFDDMPIRSKFVNTPKYQITVGHYHYYHTF